MHVLYMREGVWEPEVRERGACMRASRCHHHVDCLLLVEGEGMHVVRQMLMT